jgi:multidrug efflux pump subunit AcrB
MLSGVSYLLTRTAFAIVIVGGLISDLFLSIILLPTFYVWIARAGDPLPKHEVAHEQ